MIAPTLLTRRQSLQMATAAIALPAIVNSEALDYPTRPVRRIIGYPPGGSADLTARLASAWLSERLGQQFVIESRAGAATNIATEAVVNAAPDGYTLLLAAPANATNVALFAKLNFDFIRDTAPVGALIRFPDVVVVNPAVPIHSIPEEVRGKSRRLSPVLQSQPTNVKSRGALESRLRHIGENVIARSGPNQRIIVPQAIRYRRMRLAGRPQQNQERFDHVRLQPSARQIASRSCRRQIGKSQFWTRHDRIQTS